MGTIRILVAPALRGRHYETARNLTLTPKSPFPPNLSPKMNQLVFQLTTFGSSVSFLTFEIQTSVCFSQALSHP